MLVLRKVLYGICLVNATQERKRKKRNEKLNIGGCLSERYYVASVCLVLHCASLWASYCDTTIIKMKTDDWSAQKTIQHLFKIGPLRCMYSAFNILDSFWRNSILQGRKDEDNLTYKIQIDIASSKTLRNYIHWLCRFSLLVYSFSQGMSFLIKLRKRKTRRPGQGLSER